MDELAAQAQELGMGYGADPSGLTPLHLEAAVRAFIAARCRIPVAEVSDQDVRDFIRHSPDMVPLRAALSAGMDDRRADPGQGAAVAAVEPGPEADRPRESEEELDDEGNPAPLKPGDRVAILQVPWRGLKGRIVKQYLHHDCGERFWGNIIVELDDGRSFHMNGWQVEKIEGDRDGA